MTYIVDILENGFERKTIQLNDDYEGIAIATLIRKKNHITVDKSILYIHGFNDYFFQIEMAEELNKQGYNFYALDLRKYGRSYLPHQKFNDCRNLKDYYEEIEKSLEIIASEGNKQAILMGHSTGGLIATLYAKDNTGNGKFHGIILNSPFFEFNISSKILKRLIPIATTLGKTFPRIEIAGVLTEQYGESLHKGYHGEWEYILDWKPNTPPPISLGWLRAIRNGHKELKSRFLIKEPVLVLRSTKTITDKFDKEQLHTMDAVLSVKDIAQIAQNIEGNVETATIEDGMHDLILSRKKVRENVYSVISNWLKGMN